ncbi:MAG: hypothetical protein AABX19_03995 [Nanoarchaeota archaeon]
MICKTCKRNLRNKEKGYCNTCKEFHNYRYSKDDLNNLLKAYEQEARK